MNEYHFLMNTYILGSDVSNPADCRWKAVTASGIWGGEKTSYNPHTVLILPGSNYTIVRNLQN